jgi:hypothetical protein
VLKQKGRAEGFPIVDALIRDQLGHGGRVFLYNLTPNPFTLRRINMVEPSRGADPLTYDEFDRFLASLKYRYVLVPVASYWEEAKYPARPLRPSLRHHPGDQEGFLNTNSFCVP